MSDTFHIGGSATLSGIGEGKGMGAVSGFINGASFGEATGAPTQHDDGTMAVPMFHCFLDHDGSTLRTTGSSVMKMHDDGSAEFTAVYEVTAATGRFEGYTGSFRGVGMIPAGSPDHGGVARFDGTLRRV